MPASRKRLTWGAAGLRGAVLFGQRFALGLPRPFPTSCGLRSVLAPEPGERVLGVGPGIGYYGLHVARWLGP